MNKDWIQFFHHNNRDFKPRMLSVAEERCPVALFKCFCRAKTSTITWDGVPWVPEVFFFLLFAAKIERRRVGVTARSHGSYEPHFHAILKQDSLPNRFLVGSVCLRNLTCLHVGQWCIRQRVMLSNWGMANFVSSVSITPVKRLTSVNSVYI